jgi:hypothetical protein
MQRTPPLTLDTTRLAADGPFLCCYGDCTEAATASVLGADATWQVTTAPKYRDQQALPLEFCAAHATAVAASRNSASLRFRNGAKIEGPSMSDVTPPPKKSRKAGPTSSSLHP